MFDFDEMENTEDDDILEDDGKGKKKDGGENDDAVDWNLEDDLEDEEDMQ